MGRPTREHRYFWTYRQVCTQDGAGGGTLQADITPATGTVIRLIAARIVASGNRAANWFLLEAGGTSTYALLQATAAAAGAVCSIPATAVTSTTTGSATESNKLDIPEDIKLVGNVVSAAQTETATIELVFEIIGHMAKPTVSWANSGGTPNAAAAAKDQLRSVPAV